ncbi:hypothetical protein MIND_00818200 [Mycena indigotica]|uniref:Uncharacterized protein n=1 Tax=Mycena indigotica TaxID=2126181 RepID=A0A8H6SFR0_9AGAR|nr:uncharacterized protein MIND_00818200 [Mycena indigotica]KAF7298708.1 hypothetical protein MIND_00818200 [Mycena indigotica]
MPTLFSLDTRDRTPSQTTTFAFQQRLLLCLAVVLAAVLASFGVARLIDYATRGRPVVELEQEKRDAENTLAKETAALAAPRRRPAKRTSSPSARCSTFFARRTTMCFKPVAPFYATQYTDAHLECPVREPVSYIQSSPTLHHITAQRLYAAKHAHRSKKASPAPVDANADPCTSPLRNVLLVAEDFEVDVTDQAKAVLESQKEANLKLLRVSVKNALKKIALAQAHGPQPTTSPLSSSNHNNNNNNNNNNAISLARSTRSSLSLISDTNKSYGSKGRNRRRGFSLEGGKENVPARGLV